MNNKGPIGVMDAGWGGMTVVKELQKILPNEDIIFYGDGENQPYGNRPKDEILNLTHQCMDFLRDKDAKVVAVACNTISTLIDEYKGDYDIPIFSLVKAGSDDVIESGLKNVGLLATMFTAQSGCYEKLIHQSAPDVNVYAQGCPMLARIIEDGDFDQKKIRDELSKTLGHLASEHPELNALILGCTHYYMVKDNIKDMYPQFTKFVYPAATQAKQIKAYLEHNDGLNPCGNGTFSLYTTSDVDVYRNMARLVGLEPKNVELVPAPKRLYN